MKHLRKYTIFICVILCSLVLLWFKNEYQRDYTELKIADIEEKIKNKDSFVISFVNITASNKEAYQENMMYLFASPNEDVIKMNKFNRDYVSDTRKLIYYNTEIYSKEEELKKIFNDLFKDVELEEINFDNIPVTVWIKDGKIFYAGIGQTSKDEYLLLTDYITGVSKKEPDVSKITFTITETDDDELEDVDLETENVKSENENNEDVKNNEKDVLQE